MTTVAVRELKNRLSEYLRKVKAGERVVITERGRAIAMISAAETPVDEEIDALVRERAARWLEGSRRAPGDRQKSRALLWLTPSSRTGGEALPGYERAGEALR